MNTEPPSSPSSAGSCRCEIQIQNPSRAPEAQARRLRPWLSTVVAELAPGADSFAVRLTGDREMRRLNRDFRGKDHATDVLSFPGEEPLVAGDGHHLGDVVIAVPTARRQAAQHRHGLERELRVLLLHGLLHCLGHDHETDDGTMERLERRLRRRFLDAEPPP